MKVTNFKIDSNPLFICDMRLGFNEDGLEVTLPQGVYDLVISNDTQNEVQGFSLVMQAAEPDKDEEIGKLAVDGACVGVFSKRSFLLYFENNWESLYEWSSEISSSNNSWRDISHEKAGLAFYVSTLCDCECLLVKLYSCGEVVGLKVLPVISDPEPTKDETWVWISFVCNGIHQEFEICHYESEDVVDDVLRVLCTVETDESIDFIDEDSVCLDEPITSYRKNFKGLKSVKVSLEKERERYSIYPEISEIISDINKNSTTNDLAECMLNIYKKAIELG